MTTTATTRTPSNGQPRPTLASQLDRLDGILDGLDAALAGAVQEAVEQAVKQAVQAVLTEVLTNRPLHEQLHQAAPPPTPEESHGSQSMAQRLWQATTAGLRRAIETVQQAGRGARMALVAAGGVVAGAVYAARRRLVSLARAVYRQGQTLLGQASKVLARLLPTFARGDT